MTSGSPSVFLLGDSRGRFSFAHLAPDVCERRLRCNFIGRCRANSSVVGLVSQDTKGIVQCARDSGLGQLGYALHYGVSASPPYHIAPRHYNAADARLGSRMIMRRDAAFRQQSRPPLLVVLSSLLWDLGRRLKLPKQPDEEWAAAYETNLTAASQAVQGTLDAGRDEHLVLVADYGCLHEGQRGGDGGSYCHLYGGTAARLAARAAKAVGRRLGLHVIDLERRFRGRLPELLMWQQMGANKSSVGYMHPAPAGACVLWAALRRAGRRGASGSASDGVKSSGSSQTSTTTRATTMPLLPQLPSAPLCETICRLSRFSSLCT